MPVKFVYFDLDDTLLDHARAERAALRDLYDRHRDHMNGLSFDDVHEHYRRINPEVWRAYSSGEIDKDEARTRRFIRLGNAVSITDSGVLHSLPDEYLDRYACHWTPVPGAFDAFVRLSGVVPVGILTNGFAEIQQAKFRQFPLLEQTASAVVISELVGSMKPSPGIFKHAAELAGVAPSEILYVGDSLRSDIRGGRSAGWQVAWYGAPEDTTAAVAKHDLGEVFGFTEWKDLLRHATTLIGSALP